MLTRSMAAARLASQVVCRAQLSASRALNMSIGSRWPRLGGIVGEPGTKRIGSTVIPGWSALQGRWMSSGDTVKLHIVEPSGHSVEVIAKIGERYAPVRDIPLVLRKCARFFTSVYPLRLRLVWDIGPLVYVRHMLLCTGRVNRNLWR